MKVPWNIKDVYMHMIILFIYRNLTTIYSLYISWSIFDLKKVVYLHWRMMEFVRLDHHPQLFGEYYSQHLWKILVSWDDEIPNWMEK